MCIYSETYGARYSRQEELILEIEEDKISGKGKSRNCREEGWVEWRRKVRWEIQSLFDGYGISVEGCVSRQQDDGKGLWKSLKKTMGCREHLEPSGAIELALHFQKQTAAV